MFEVILEWIQTLGAAKMEKIFLCKKDMNFEGPKVGYYELNYAPQKVHIKGVIWKMTVFGNRTSEKAIKIK